MSWNQLKNIIDEAKKEAEKPKVNRACPVCARALEEARGVKHCPHCGWTDGFIIDKEE